MVIPSKVNVKELPLSFNSYVPVVVSSSIRVVSVKDEAVADHSKSEDHCSPLVQEFETDPVPSRAKTKFWFVQLVASSGSQKLAVHEPAKSCSYILAEESDESLSLEQENINASKKGKSIFFIVNFLSNLKIIN